MDEETGTSLRKHHHEKEPLCTNRPKYRDGRMLKAVKAYTVSDESKYLVVKNISVVHGAYEGLLEKMKGFGDIEEERVLKEYPLEESEKFTKVALIKFTRIPSARIAKRRLDDLNYLGEILHLCYAPEFETIDETRDKLEERRRAVMRRLRQLDEEKKGIQNMTQTDSSKHKRNNISSRKDPSIHSNISYSPSLLEHSIEATCTSTIISIEQHKDHVLRLIPRQVQNAHSRLNANSSLKENSLTLSDSVQGPQLPEQEERKRKMFSGSETGDQSLDESVAVLRTKMAKIS